MTSTLEAQVGQGLQARGWTLAVAESCTGGLIGHSVTRVPGSSAYFLGGVISYANRIKADLLGVSPATLETDGAVSQATAEQMAVGARNRLGADVGLSVTGIAGPTGGSAEKPVGLTWIGIAGPVGVRSQRFVYDGDRAAVRKQAADSALHLLLDYLEPVDE
ncbi:MAG: CinA family protein [Anaerolineales bacterium]